MPATGSYSRDELAAVAPAATYAVYYRSTAISEMCVTELVYMARTWRFAAPNIPAAASKSASLYSR
jgi:hypothetical protein